MNTNLVSYLRHAFTGWIAAAVVYLTAKLMLDATAVQAVEQALKQIGDGLLLLIITLAPVIGRLVWSWIANALRLGSGETKGVTGNGVSGGTALLLLGTMAALGSLPSCNPEQLAAARTFPIKATVHTPQGDLSYSAKGGLEIEVDATSGK